MVSWVPPGPTLLTTAGIVAIIYGDMLALWTSRHDSVSNSAAGSLLVFVRDWLNTPLGLSEDFSTLGSCLLLVVGGYSITAIAGRHSLRMLVVLTCMLSMLWCGIALSASLVLLGGRPLVSADTTATPADLATDFLLAGGMTGRTLIPLAWPIVIVLLFGGLLLCTSLLQSSTSWLTVAVQLCVIVVPVMISVSGVDAWSTDGSQVADKMLVFAAMPIVGEVVRLNRTGRMSSLAACGYAAAAIALPIAVEVQQPTLAAWWHPVTALFAALLGALCLRTARTRAFPPPIRWLATRAIALLLVSGTLGYATLNAVGAAVWLPLTACIALLVVVITAELMHQGGALLYRVLTRCVPCRPGECHRTSGSHDSERGSVDSPL